VRAAGRQALDALAAVIIAPECAACGQVLEQPSGGPVCEACWRAIRRFTPPLCPSCGEPVSPPATAPSLRCPTCRDHERAVARARAVGPYEGRLRDIIHAFKYDKRRSLSRRLAALLRDAGGDVLDGADAAVPVPLHWTRRHQRGFNQAALLAAGLGLPVVHALRRGRRTRPQVDLPAADRHRNVRGAFSVAWRVRWPWPPWIRRAGVGDLSGLTVVLVDDVSTTGATLDACAGVLLAAGVQEVRALTLARVASQTRWRRRHRPASWP
jgi:ComF family protein